MMNRDQRRGSPPGAARPPPSRRGRPAIPGRAIAPTASLSPQGFPLVRPRSPRAQSSPCDPATRAFPSPPPPGRGRGRWQRAPAGLFSGRTGTRDNGPQRGFEGDAGGILSREAKAGGERDRGGLKEARARLTSPSPPHPRSSAPKTTNKRPQTKLKLKREREIKGMTGRGWRRTSLAQFCDKIAPGLGATEAELGQGRPAERAHASLKGMETFSFTPRVRSR